MSEKRLFRYVIEFQSRHNSRAMDTVEQMSDVVKEGTGKRLKYEDLISDKN